MYRPQTTTLLGGALLSGASCLLLTFIKRSAVVLDDDDFTLRNPDENASCIALGLPTPTTAQASHVHLVKSFLSPVEIEQLVSFARQMKHTHKVGVATKDKGGVLSSSIQDTVWTTSFLHTNNLLEKHLPDLQKKLLNGLLAVDQEVFHVVDNNDDDDDDNDNDDKVLPLNLRTVEYHEYVPGGNLKEQLHYDAGSLITIDILLEDDFVGGELAFPEIDGSTTVIGSDQFQKGDAAFFVSHKYHNVSPITSGKRTVLVCELWRGPQKCCPHRCKRLGNCTYSLGRSHLEQSREHLSILG